MPDLSHKAVHQFWKAYQDPTLYRVICFMEGVEHWTLDGHEEVEVALKRLGEILDEIGNIDLKRGDDMVDLVAHLKTGRGLRCLMALDQAYPGAATKIIAHAEQTTKSESDMAGVFLRRNVVFERLRLLSRVFSPERVKLVTKALEESQ